MAHLTTYTDYEIPLLLILSEFPNGQGSSADVLRRFWARFQALIPPEYTERVRVSGNTDLKWENIVRWVRNSLVKRGQMDAPAYGIWGITDAGRAYLAETGDFNLPADPLSAVSSPLAPKRSASISVGSTQLTADHDVEAKAADADPWQELTRSEYVHEVQAQLKRVLSRLSREMHSPAFSVPRQNIMQIRFPALANCYYQLRLSAGGNEGGIYFEGPEGQNQARMKAFLPRQEELSRTTFQQVRVEEWKSNQTRVLYKEPKTSHLYRFRASMCVASFVIFISETYPILNDVVEQTKSRDEQISEVVDFLNGRRGRPNDEQLCDRVRLCYEFERYSEGRDLFALVDPTQVNPGDYERAKRYAKVCAMKVAGHA